MGALSPYCPLTMNVLAINQQINNPQNPNHKQHKQSSKTKITLPNNKPNCLHPKHQFIQEARKVQPYARVSFTQILSMSQIDITILSTTPQSNDVYRELTLLTISQVWEWQLANVFLFFFSPFKRKKGSIYRWRKALIRISPNQFY